MENNYRMPIRQSWLFMMIWALSLALTGGALAQSGGALVLTQPTYNCSTGVITFNTTGGDGTPIEFQAPGITAWTTNPTQILDACARTCADIPPFMISARQSGKIATYSWSRQTYCANVASIVSVRPIADITLAVGQGLNFAIGTYFSSSPTTSWGVGAGGLPPGISYFYRSEGPPVPTPTFALIGTATTAGVYSVTASASANGGSASITFKIIVTNGMFTLTAPTYNCLTGAFTFNTSGGDGTQIEYQSPGITGWTTNPNQFVDKDSRTANDVKPFTLMARQSGQVVTLNWDLKAACGRARVGLEEPGGQLSLKVLGNPAREQLRVLVEGVQGQSVQLRLTDVSGRLLEKRTIELAGAAEEQSFQLDQSSPGLLLLQATTNTQIRNVKVIKQ